MARLADSITMTDRLWLDRNPNAMLGEEARWL